MKNKVKRGERRAAVEAADVLLTECSIKLDAARRSMTAMSLRALGHPAVPAVEEAFRSAVKAQVLVKQLLSKLPVACIILALAGCASFARGERRWGYEDVALEGAFATAVMLDANQTFWNPNRPPECSESNPIVGPCGDRVPLEVYLPAAIIGHVVVSHLIPRGGWRTAFQSVTLGFEAAVIYGNYVLGYGLGF